MSDNILIEYARERLSNLSSVNIKRPDFVCDFKPSDFIVRFTTDAELLKLLGRKGRQRLSSLASFFEIYKHITSNYLTSDQKNKLAPSRETTRDEEISSLCPTFAKPVSIIPISARNKVMLKLYKSKSAAHRTIKLLVKIGGIQAVSSNYRFGNAIKQYNSCMYYAYNKVVEQAVFRLAKELKIKYTTPPQSLIEQGKDCFVDAEIFNQLKVSSKLRIKTCCPNETIKAMLTKKYERLIKPRLLKIGEMNNVLPPEQQIRFDWNIKRGKASIKKIAIRATSKIVSLKAHPNANPNYKGMWRSDYLDDHFGEGRFWHYDVHGSIYQITHLLNYGDWMGNSTDPYKQMFGSNFKTEIDRRAFKSLCMSLYFDRPNCVVIHNRTRTRKVLRKYGVKTIEKTLSKAADNMKKFTGKSFDSEIFLHESLLYIDFVYALRKKKVDVVQIYDGFYFSRKDLIDVESLMRQTAANYYKDYMEFVRSESSSCD